MATVLESTREFDLAGLSIDVVDLTADGLGVDPMGGAVDGERRLQLTAARTGRRDKTIVAGGCGCSVSCATRPQPIGCCCS